jgi:hypothetical protein
MNAPVHNRWSEVLAHGHQRELKRVCSGSPSLRPSLPYVISVLAAPVAQTCSTCSLLYRRFLTCHLSPASNVLPITNRRYGRLKICATVNTYSPPAAGESRAISKFWQAVSSVVGRALRVTRQRRAALSSRTFRAVRRLFPLLGGQGEGGRHSLLRSSRGDEAHPQFGFRISKSEPPHVSCYEYQTGQRVAGRGRRVACATQRIQRTNLRKETKYETNETNHTH